MASASCFSLKLMSLYYGKLIKLYKHLIQVQFFDNFVFIRKAESEGLREAGRMFVVLNVLCVFRVCHTV